MINIQQFISNSVNRLLYLAQLAETIAQEDAQKAQKVYIAAQAIIMELQPFITEAELIFPNIKPILQTIENLFSLPLPTPTPVQQPSTPV